MFKLFNLYFQFSGYTDVAIGFALLLGFRVMENFDNPFLKQNISEFWRSWHISLSSWVRDYVFFPIVSVVRNRALAVMVAMLVLGLWHEASFRFLLWGLYHGAGIVAWHLLQKAKSWAPVTLPTSLSWTVRVLSTLLTVNFVMLSFVFTKERDLVDAFGVWIILFEGVF